MELAYTANTDLEVVENVYNYMLRTQNIPPRLEVGYVEEEYHAWISTYIKDVGWVNGIIEFNGSTWN